MFMFMMQIDILQQEVLSAASYRIAEVSGMMHVMSDSITDLAISQNTSWPYYTQSDFATSFGQTYLVQSGVSFISWSPIVKGEFGKIEWGVYSSQNAGEWMPSTLVDQIPPYIHITNEQGQVVPDDGPDPFVPVWQMAVPDLKDVTTRIDPTAVNFNALHNPSFADTFKQMNAKQSSAISGVMNASEIYGSSIVTTEASSLLLTPIYTELPTAGDIVGTLVSVVPWTLFFQDILHPSEPLMYVVVEQHEVCGEALSFTIEIDGETASYVGPGEQIEQAYAGYSASTNLGQDGVNEDTCYFTATVYASEEVHVAYTQDDNAAAVWTSIVVLVFLLAGVVFFSYDYAVQRRQMKTMNSAAKTNAVLASLFPTEVRDRLIGRKTKSTKNYVANEDLPTSGPAVVSESATFRLKTFLAEEALNGVATSIPSDDKFNEAIAGIDMQPGRPIADLFPNTTVMFADIAGFTAWSSVREPSQVFVLLETVYQAFDAIAKRRKVFKVETVGDCYVAVTGLPEPRKDHAVIMTKFAKECLEKFNELSKQLEISLGPDTVRNKENPNVKCDNHI
jgi:hypothetical protein